MLDKLRRQFIFIIMALVTAALAIMAGVILFINYQQLSGDVLESVEYATSEMAFEGRDGKFAGPGAKENPGSAAPADRGEFGHMDRAPSANMVATSVYVVPVDGSANRTLVDALELDEETLQAALQEALAAKTSATGGRCVTGYIAQSDLYYGVRQTAMGTKVAFASGSYIANSIGNLAMVLAAVMACVWVAFLVVSVLLARWVVRPTERAWSQQQQFVADASHELKTPLAVMMANNSILLSNESDTIANQRRWVESNQVEARQMLELVNDMLFLARPENADRQTALSDVDFSALAERNVLQFEAVCFERGVVLESDVAPGITVRGDANRLQRLVSTLVDNACKYADAKAKVELARVGNQAVLSISNDGAVIPAEDLPHVFDRFYRVDKARVRSEGGVGLGLAIAQEVAREHGGSIRVASSEEAGTVFTATLPCV